MAATLGSAAIPFNWAWHSTRTGRSTLARAGRQSARAMELTLAAMALSEGIFREAATTRWMYSSGWAFLYMLRTNFSVNSRRLVWTCLYIPTMVVMNWGSCLSHANPSTRSEEHTSEL